MWLLDSELIVPGFEGGQVETLRPLVPDREIFPDPFHEGARCKLGASSIDLSRLTDFPARRSDLKIMRQEVVAAVCVVGRLLAGNARDESAREALALFATTSFGGRELEDELDGIIAALHHVEKGSEVESLKRALHPLFGLKALTNSAEAFVAQTYGLRGENATFGDLSSAGRAALEAASMAFELGKSSEAIVLGTSTGSIYNLHHSESYASPSTELLRESPGVAALLFSAKHVNGSPKLRTVTRDQEKFDLGIFTGFDRERLKCGAALRKWEACKDQISLAEIWGSLGSASLPVALALAGQHLRSSVRASVLVLDVDAFGQATEYVLEGAQK
jgi:hypothetical protein